MNKVTSRLRQFIKSEDGISSVEYALLLALIAAGIAAAAGALGTAVDSSIDAATTELGGTPPN